jgi:hypothetical protein
MSDCRVVQGKIEIEIGGNVTKCTDYYRYLEVIFYSFALCLLLFQAINIKRTMESRPHLRCGTCQSICYARKMT